MDQWNDAQITCPFCGEQNAPGSNICGGCMRDIRELANPNRSDFEQTAKTPHPKPPGGWLGSLKRWWNRRRRRAN